MTVTKSDKSNVAAPSIGNALAVFVDIDGNQLKVKDINGNIDDVSAYVGDDNATGTSTSFADPALVAMSATWLCVAMPLI